MGRFEKASVQESLPKLFAAIESLQVTTGAAPASGAMNIAVVEMTADNKLVCSSLSADWVSQIQAWFSATGLAKFSEPMMAVVGSLTWILVPMSKVKTTAKQKSRQAGLDAGRFWSQAKFERLCLATHLDLNAADMIEGLLIGGFQLETFKGEGETQKTIPSKIETIGVKLSDQSVLEAKTYAAASILTRTVQDAPANWFDSERFAKFAEMVAKDTGIKLTVKGREEMQALGMGSFLSVAQGSDIDPKLILMEIKGSDPSKTVALIGKGLTFDAGGVSLKPALGMHEMKYDMSGGAAVLGAAYFLGKVKPKYNVVCAIGAVENVMSGKATKPGDVVRAYNGKTIEILNTDAEGRLVLADMLSYVEKQYSPQYMVDIATLTGAVLFGLGSAGCGLMTNDEAFGDLMLKVAQKTGEPAWKLPLWPELEKETASDIADYKNIASPDTKAGTIMGGMFLKEFVGERKWVHLDIAGTGWNCKATGFPSKGGSAFGVRMLTRLCFEEL